MLTITAIILTRCFARKRSTCIDSEKEDAAKVNIQPNKNANSRTNQKLTANLAALWGLI